MKKLIFAALLVLIVSSICCTTLALASTPQQIANEIKGLDGVDDVRVALSNKVCFVAVKPSGVISKTQCQKLRNQIVERVNQLDEEMQVVVSFNVKLFCQIEKIEKLPAHQRQAELDKLMERFSKIPMPLNCK